MSAQDPQATGYPQTYPPTLDSCVCGHLVTVHMLSETTRKRMHCSSWERRGIHRKCLCKKYKARGEADV